MARSSLGDIRARYAARDYLTSTVCTPLIATLQGMSYTLCTIVGM